MPTFDLILRGGTLVTDTGLEIADIGVSEGIIQAVGSDISDPALESVDASGLHIFPGVLDAHVHFNEPGRAHWEGLETGSRALAAGGGTLFVDMPLNAHPPTIDAAAFELKVAAAQAKSVTDFALWGGLVPGNVDKLESLADRGVVGFKAFMSNSGIDDFERVDDATLFEGMKVAAKWRLLVAVHAEDELMTQHLAQSAQSRGGTSVRDYIDSRPVAAELAAIRRALDMAGETGCALHVVHVSSGEGIRLISEAKAQGVNVSAETCPHYLALGDADMEKIGALAKCAPPLRGNLDRDQLRQRLVAGEVDTVGSDHSPSPLDLKQDHNFFKVWGGIASVQLTLSLMITESQGHPGLTLPSLARLLSFNVADRFKLPGKGEIELGNDADFAVVDLGKDFEVRNTDLLTRHPLTPYAGRSLRGKVMRTILRGRTLFRDGKIATSHPGRLVKPRL